MRFGFKRRSDWPNFRQLIGTPDKFTQEEASGGVIRQMAQWYHQDFLEFQNIGWNGEGRKPTESAAAIFAERIKQRQLKEAEEVIYGYAHLLDNDLLLYSRNSARAGERIATFYRKAFLTLAVGKEAQRICRSEELRIDAFNDAFSRFWQKCKPKEFRFEKCAVAYFKNIFLKECAVKARNANTQKEKNNRNWLDVATEGMTNADLLYNPPVDQEGMIFERLRKEFPRCYMLVYLNKIQGYKFVELEEKFGKKAGQLKKEAYRCRQKLQARYRELTR